MNEILMFPKDCHFEDACEACPVPENEFVLDPGIGGVDIDAVHSQPLKRTAESCCAVLCLFIASNQADKPLC